MYGTKRKL